MDLGITNIFIFYVRSELILSIVISQPSFDHRLTLAIYLTASVWVNQYKRNREFGYIYSPKFHDAFHVSKITVKTSYYYFRSKSLITLYSTQRTPPQCFLRLCATKCAPMFDCSSTTLSAKNATTTSEYAKNATITRNSSASASNTSISSTRGERIGINTCIVPKQRATAS